MSDVNVDLKIPDAHVTLALTAISAMVDVPIKIECNDLFEKGSGHFYVNIPAKTGGENNKQFAERWASAAIRGFIKMYKLAEDAERHAGEVSALDPVSENVDENVITPA